MLQDGSFVAVKLVSVEQESVRGERGFISEIVALSGIKHENLVTLRGCCVDGAKRLLVYNYMENNSLAYAFLGTLPFSLIAITCRGTNNVVIDKLLVDN